MDGIPHLNAGLNMLRRNFLTPSPQAHAMTAEMQERARSKQSPWSARSYCWR